MSQLRHVVAVLRSYNNKNVAKQVKSLKRTGIGKVIVVTDGLLDKGATRGWLSEMLGPNRGVELIEMYGGYTWSNALNRALETIRLGNLLAQATGAPAYSIIFNVSVEAMFTREHLVAMDAAFSDPAVGVVGTSFTGIQSGNRVDLGRSYKHPRNTGMMLRLAAMTPSAGQFDPWCDDIGGMEDIDFILRMKAFSDFTVRMLDLNVQLHVGVHYHQPTKEEKEQVAMRKITARMRAVRDRVQDVIDEFDVP